jgi:hypothetical protein
MAREGREAGRGKWGVTGEILRIITRYVTRRRRRDVGDRRDAPARVERRAHTLTDRAIGDANPPALLKPALAVEKKAPLPTLLRNFFAPLQNIASACPRDHFHLRSTCSCFDAR